MNNRLSDLVRLAEGKMTLDRFKELHDIFEPLTDEEYFALTSSKYIYEEVQPDKHYKMIHFENGKRTGVPQNTKEDRKAIDYANQFSIDLFKIGELQIQLQKEVQTAALFSNVTKIEQQIEDLWNKLFGKNKPSICSVIPRSLLVDIYQNFSSYLIYSNANEFANEILFDNPIKCKGETKTAFRYLFTHVLDKMSEGGFNDIVRSNLIQIIFKTDNKGLKKPENKKHKIYSVIDAYLAEFDVHKFK